MKVIIVEHVIFFNAEMQKNKEYMDIPADLTRNLPRPPGRAACPNSPQRCLSGSAGRGGAGLAQVTRGAF